MAHIDLAAVPERPTPLKRFLAARMVHIRQMLLASAIAAGGIVVIAATMMTAL